jgi:hypothetical protein
MRAASAFAGRQRAVLGERRSPSRRRHGRSRGVARNETGQDEDRHEPRFLVSPALKVKSLPADRLLASHRAVPVRLDRKAATGLIWFWTLLEAGNGIGHLNLAATRREYFPGAATAPLLLLFSGWLLVLQCRRNG